MQLDTQRLALHYIASPGLSRRCLFFGAYVHTHSIVCWLYYVVIPITIHSIISLTRRSFFGSIHDRTFFSFSNEATTAENDSERWISSVHRRNACATPSPFLGRKRWGELPKVYTSTRYASAVDSVPRRQCYRSSRSADSCGAFASSDFL